MRATAEMRADIEGEEQWRYHGPGQSPLSCHNIRDVSASSQQRAILIPIIIDTRERERTDGACHVILLFVALNLNYISTCQVIPSYETLPHTQSWFCWTFRTNFVVCLTGLITGGKQFEMSHFVSGSKLSLDDKITLITLFSASFGIQ